MADRKPIVVTLAWGAKYWAYLPAFENSVAKFSYPKALSVLEGEADKEVVKKVKPKLLLEVLARYRQPVVWIDVDSIIEKNPIQFTQLESGGCDIAAYGPREDQLWATTVWVNSTEAARDVLIRWRELMDEGKPMPRGSLDEEYMTEAVRELKPTFRMLPPEYAWHDEWLTPLYGKRQPVIRHFGASKIKEAL